MLEAKTHLKFSLKIGHFEIRVLKANLSPVEIFYQKNMTLETVKWIKCDAPFFYKTLLGVKFFVLLIHWQQIQGDLKNIK